MALAVSAKEFLQALWGNEAGIAELAVDPKGGTFYAQPWTYPQSLDPLLDNARRLNRDGNVYMGVCLRREKWPRKTGRTNPDGTPEEEKRGTEQNTLLSNAVWVEFDFKGQGHKGPTVDPAAADRALKSLPFKPSIGVHSGGGGHIYFLMKEPVKGADLWRLKAVNKALTKFLGADTHCVDLARVLRIPGFLNVKYAPPRPVEIKYWHPELRYTLDDFDFLPVEDLAPAATTPVQSSGPQSSLDTTKPQPRNTPTIPLDEEKQKKAGKLFSQIWLEGTRHDMAMCAAGWMAFANIQEASAKAVIQIASDLKKGETKKRLKDVEDTYRRFLSGKEIMGKPTLEEVIDSDAFPEGFKDEAKKILGEIEKLFPKKRGLRARPDPDFKILNLVKFNSIPARWTVTLEKGGRKLVTTTEHSRFMNYELFLVDVCDQNTVVPEAPLKNHEWRALINEAREHGHYEEQEAPSESRPAGAIEATLQDFLSESKEEPDVGLLKKFPGRDQDSQFFKIKTFHEYLDEQGHKIQRNHLVQKLKSMGWESRPHRFSKNIERVYIKKLLDGTAPPNGNGNGHGHGPPSPPPTPIPAVPDQKVQEPKEDLFPKTEPPEAEA